MSSPKGSELSVNYATPNEMYAATIVLPVLGILFVILRLIRRNSSKAGLGVDDWLLIPALVFTISSAATLLIGVQNKAVAYPSPFEPQLTQEQEMTYVNPTISLMGQVQFASLLQFTLAYGFLKLSILFFYRRVFVVNKKSWFDWICWVMIAICVARTIAFFFAILFQCGTHISASWGSVMDYATYCNVSANGENGYVVTDLATDVLVWILPIPMIWQLQMSMGRKLAILGVLALGSIAIVASIIKTIISFQISSGGLSTDVDPELTVSTILYWCMIESGLAIIATCLPVLYQYVGKVSLKSTATSLRSLLGLSASRSSGTVDSEAQVGIVRGSFNSEARGKACQCQCYCGASQSDLEKSYCGIQVTRGFSHRSIHDVNGRY